MLQKKYKMSTCDLTTLVLAAVLILVVIFTDKIFNTLPLLKTVFTDQVNFILLSLACIFILLLDIPSGIISCLIIIYMALYVSSLKPLAKNNSRSSNMVAQAPTKTMATAKMPTMDKFANLPDGDPRSDSEIVYDQKFPIVNGNIQPFQVQDAAAMNLPNGMIPANSNEATAKSCNEPDFITRVGPPNRDGYDVTGCRYDFKDSPQNLTIYGPPLAQCSAYNSSSCTGTVFYPLHE